MAPSLLSLSASAALLGFASSQTYQRLGGCPTLGCVFPPDQVDFLPGQFFDIRLETHAPQNGTQVMQGYLQPDTAFTFNIAREGSSPVPATTFFNIQDTPVEQYNFTWYEDLFAEARDQPSLVKVAAKSYRKVALTQPGTYIATLSYGNGMTTRANWTVRDIAPHRKAKNLVMFIGDGMTTNMITGMSMCPN